MGISSTERARVGWVERRTTVPAELAKDFLVVYRDAMAPLETLAPARQALTDEEFLDAMAHESVLKFVGWNGDGEPCALALMTTDLNLVPWVSVPYFRHRFPAHYRRGAIYYVHALLVRIEHQGGPWARLLLEELVTMLARENAVGAFDSCGYTVEVTKLPELIARVARRLCVLDAVELDRQHYFGYVFQSA